MRNLHSIKIDFNLTPEELSILYWAEKFDPSGIVLYTFRIRNGVLEYNNYTDKSYYIAQKLWNTGLTMDKWQRDGCPMPNIAKMVQP